MTAQLDLPMTQKAPETTQDEVEALCAYLQGSGWIKAGEIPGWNERYIRALANASKGRIISGQLGYKLTKEATAEECAHAENWLRHQAKAMMDRAMAIKECREGF